MSKLIKYSTICLLVILTSTILIAIANAQDPDDIFPTRPNFPPYPPTNEEEAITVIVPALGGTTNPLPGEYTTTFEDTITLQATPNSGYKFEKWIISGQYAPGHNIPAITYPNFVDPDDPDYVPDFPSPSAVQADALVTSTNPLTVICGYGYTYVYQPVFIPTTSSPSTNNAIVVILDSLGGSTTPGAGTYYYLEDSTISLEATPDAGYEFDSWVAVSEEEHPSQFTDNPTNIICGYGYTFEYQAMFAPTGSTTTGEGIAAEYLYAVIVVLAILAVIGVGAALMYRGKNK